MSHERYFPFSQIDKSKRREGSIGVVSQTTVAYFRRQVKEGAHYAPKVVACMEAVFEDAMAVMVLPKKCRRRLRTTNMQETFDRGSTPMRTGDSDLPQ